MLLKLRGNAVKSTAFTDFTQRHEQEKTPASLVFFLDRAVGGFTCAPNHTATGVPVSSPLSHYMERGVNTVRRADSCALLRLSKPSPAPERPITPQPTLRALHRAPAPSQTPPPPATPPQRGRDTVAARRAGLAWIAQYRSPRHRRSPLTPAVAVARASVCVSERVSVHSERVSDEVRDEPPSPRRGCGQGKRTNHLYFPVACRRSDKGRTT